MSFKYYLVMPLPIIQFHLNFFPTYLKDILMISPATTLRLVLVVFNSYLPMLNRQSFPSYSFPCSLIKSVKHRQNFSGQRRIRALETSIPNESNKIINLLKIWKSELKAKIFLTFQEVRSL